MWHNARMRCLSTSEQRALAELNRRVLAGRPTPASVLARLELLYQEVNDVWGPPCRVPAGLSRTSSGIPVEADGAPSVEPS